MLPPVTAAALLVLTTKERANIVFLIIFFTVLQHTYLVRILYLINTRAELFGAGTYRSMCIDGAPMEPPPPESHNNAVLLLELWEMS